MKREQRLFLQRLLLIVSFLVAIGGTFLWYHTRTTGAPMQSWLKAVVAYGWTFVVFWTIDRFARAQARKKRPEHFRRPPDA